MAAKLRGTLHQLLCIFIFVNTGCGQVESNKNPSKDLLSSLSWPSQQRRSFCRDSTGLYVDPIENGKAWIINCSPRRNIWIIVSKKEQEHRNPQPSNEVTLYRTGDVDVSDDFTVATNREESTTSFVASPSWLIDNILHYSDRTRTRTLYLKTTLSFDHPKTYSSIFGMHSCNEWVIITSKQGIKERSEFEFRIESVESCQP